MKDINGKIQYNGKEYNLVFNLNVMEKIQEEYGSLDKWGSLTDGTQFAMDQYEKENGSLTGWDDLDDSEREKYRKEPNAKAVIFGFTEMINEGIDMANEENGTNESMLSLRQVGRMITQIGLMNATSVMNRTVIDSTQSEEKNA